MKKYINSPTALRPTCVVSINSEYGKNIGDKIRELRKNVRRRVMKSFFAPISLWCVKCSAHHV